MSNTFGLVKKQELDNGAVAEFWKIAGAAYVENEPVSQVFLLGWLSKDVHLAGKQHLAFVKVDLNKELTDVIRKTFQLPTKELLYELVRQVPQYADAKVELLPTSDGAPVPKVRKNKA